jgi:hypothetical protein
MDRPESLPLGEKAVPEDNLRGKFIFQGGDILIEGPPYEAAERTLFKVSAEGINGQYTADFFVLLPAPLRRALHGFHLKKSGLEFAVFIGKAAPKPVAFPGDKLFFQKGPVKTDQYRPGALILYMDFEGLHAACPEPVVGQDLDYRTDRSLVKIFEGDPAAAVFPVPGITAEQLSHAGDSCLGEGTGRCGTCAPDTAYGRVKLPEKHR